MNLVNWFGPRKDPIKCQTVEAVAKKEGALSLNRYEAGYFVSTDQYIMRTPGRLTMCNGIQ